MSAKQFKDMGVVGAFGTEKSLVLNIGSFKENDDVESSDDDNVSLPSPRRSPENFEKNIDYMRRGSKFISIAPIMVTEEVK